MGYMDQHDMQEMVVKLSAKLVIVERVPMLMLRTRIGWGYDNNPSLMEVWDLKFTFYLFDVVNDDRRQSIIDACWTFAMTRENGAPEGGDWKVWVTFCGEDGWSKPVLSVKDLLELLPQAAEMFST